MISLPNECYHEIFNNFQSNYKFLFSCALVNRQWCRVIIPILWSKPGHHFKNKKLINILLLSLNAEEQTLLIPFNITLSNYQKPLFEYTSYITFVSNFLYEGIRDWLPSKKNKLGNELENAVDFSLITMLLRTSKNLKFLSLNEIICNQIIFEKVYENTTVTSMQLCNVDDGFKYKAIDRLAKILSKDSTLTSLHLSLYQLEFEGVKTLLEALYKNTTLNSLDLGGTRIGETMLAKFLCKNKVEEL
ncbi:f-box domain-containing protein [Gigaspora margarita]|uniref:F-box domain-containing protein n=1 Tax=Gigaspora margarita TaxID=4874 RepID=A0A8H4AW00_GIGMA|nr:f-box domain-containing protein [Gigaspora margarita]